MESNQQSSAFLLLHEKVKRWIWEQQWTELRDAQEDAIPVILECKRDVIIAASTASGKTEAAFLPILSKTLTDAFEKTTIVYLSPLKALINDQFRRMEQLCDNLDIKVYPWHGDISSSKKRKFLKEPSGVLLITPESLESLFVNHGYSMPFIFDNLKYVVVDELHSFIGTERGKQLQSLLHRIELSIKRHVTRIGLSATIGDMQLAADFLRPCKGDSTKLIVSNDRSHELKLLLRGYNETVPEIDEVHNDQLDSENTDDENYDGSIFNVCEDLYKTLRGKSNLVFANSRQRVEFFADRLRQMCEERRVPNEFWPHHGNLSKELREDAESAIKDKTMPVSIVCTSTLEMGIDIGAVNSIAQVGTPPSVASMRQRLGRSGRRGDAAILRIYIVEREITKNTHPVDTLRSELVQTIAMVKLLIDKWYEPPPANGLHLSTLVQQVMSLIAQHGGVTASQAWTALCSNGPFALIDQNLFSLLEISEKVAPAAGGIIEEKRQEIRECYVPRASR